MYISDQERNGFNLAAGLLQREMLSGTQPGEHRDDQQAFSLPCMQAKRPVCIPLDNFDNQDAGVQCEPRQSAPVAHQCRAGSVTS